MNNGSRVDHRGGMNRGSRGSSLRVRSSVVHNGVETEKNGDISSTIS